jgi:oxygen-independent coproporphyrinogen III oxidase
VDPRPSNIPQTLSTSNALMEKSIVGALRSLKNSPLMIPEPEKLEFDEETSVGNYFVSNYPPYSFWSPENVSRAVDVLNRKPESDHSPLGLYLHIPFCRKRCHFCYFRVYTGKNSKQIRSYLDAALAELRSYSRKPFCVDRKLNFVYLGGGTPSYLSTAQLTELTDNMKRLFPWDEAEEVTFECEPGTLTEQKLQTIKNIGVTRLSLGVENFDDVILQLNGRAHRSKEILRAYDFARSCNYPQINIDLIAGMVGETRENWEACVQKAISLSPDSITIYQLEIPYNTTLYRDADHQGIGSSQLMDWRQKRSSVDHAFSELEKSGYTITSGYTAVKNPDKTTFVYRDQLWTGADLIGIGIASFSHIAGIHFQNEHDWDPYLRKINNGELPIYRALVTTPEERLVRELILQLKLGKVSTNYFRTKFDVDIIDKFKTPLTKLEKLGFLFHDGDLIVCNRKGLLRVDALAREFFLTRHQKARYA